MRRFVSQPSELCAGAAFALAGFSSGRGDCARGGWAAGRCVPAGMFRACLTPAVRSCWNVLRSITPAVRSCWNVPRSITPAARFYRGVLRSITSAARFYRGVLRSITPAVRFCWNVLRSSHARRAFLLECSALVSRPPCGSVGMFRARSRPPCVPVGKSCARSRPPCGSIAVFCARSRPPCGSITVFCARLTPAVRSCWKVLRSITPAARFYCGVLRSSHARRAVLLECLALDHACRAVLSRCFALDHACCLTHSAKQDGLRYFAFLFRGSRSPFVRSRGVGAVVCLCGFTSGLAVYLWRSRRSYRGRGGMGDGVTRERSRRRGVSALSRNHIGFAMFSAGSTLGLRAPNLRQRAIGSLDSLHLGRGGVRFTRRGRSG